MGKTEMPEKRRDSPGAFEKWARRAVFVCLGLIFLQACAWQIAGGLVKLGYSDFLIFGVDAAMVIGAMPTYILGGVAAVFQALILLSIVQVALRRRRAMVLLGAAALLHLLIWVRVSFNPYVPAWPGLVIFTAEMVSMILLSMLAARRQLR